MTSPFSDELISAYLDGELTAEEQVRVEKQLREDAQLRRMCDELRALRFTLQSLPAAEPAQDLADRVLRQAERRMLTGDEATAGTITPRATADQAGSERTPLLRRWRVAAGVAASLAALLLLALWLPGQLPHDRAVAVSGPAPANAPATAMDTDREEPFRSTETLANQLDERLHEAPDARFGTGSASDLGASNLSRAADDRAHSRFIDPALPGDVMLKAAPSGANGIQAETTPAPLRSLEGGEADADTASPEPSNEPSFGRSGSAASSEEKAFSVPQPAAAPPESGRGQQEGTRHVVAGAAVDPAASSGSPQPGDTTETPLATGDSPDDMGRTLTPFTKEADSSPGDVAASADMQQESRQAVTQQLVSEFDKSQLLLVQVSMPVDVRQDPSNWFDLGTQDVVRLGEKLTQELALQQSATNYYSAPQEGIESLGTQLAYPVRGVILVEGSPEQVRTSLTRLVAQPEVQVLATNTSPEQLRVLSVAMDNLSRGRELARDLNEVVAPGTDTGPGAGMGFGGGMMGGGAGGYGGASGAGMLPGLGGAVGGSGNLAGQGGYPGLGTGVPSTVPGQAPQDAPRGGALDGGRRAGGTDSGATADQSANDKAGLPLQRSQLADRKGNPPREEGQVEDESPGERAKQSQSGERVDAIPAPPAASRAMEAGDRPGMSRGATGRRSADGVESSRLESSKSQETASTAPQRAEREVVTYLFRLKSAVASPAPAEPSKQP